MTDGTSISCIDRADGGQQVVANKCTDLTFHISCVPIENASGPQVTKRVTPATADHSIRDESSRASKAGAHEEQTS
ncbi:hypothetical protein N7539_000575 [Penicillium diatomitis]|uniref:Uncharacterized protein n=1 Tax=Penicillium diatomitis TaxID=2819901 RepID=A0A9X0C2V3_9EURO|nr:uncharacterized protein N7539_000575 [Penicillium diatomitis]KAJ5495459.1 hypothetical protein N7539_000575 [Penicillium diatomitis]